MTRLFDHLRTYAEALFPGRAPAGVDVDRCGPETLVPFRCNLCADRNTVAFKNLQRELPSCGRCGSTVRFRAIGHLVAREVFGTDAVLPRLPRRPAVRGLGLSDATAYAQPLSRRLHYENTYYHQEPRLDITAIAADRLGRYDFVIASDVFEHVLPPVGRAFVNARRLLKPGGVFILTVPFVIDGPTVEHFPDIADWHIEGSGAERVLVNRTPDGREHRHGNLCFHGGDGSTLEWRLFSRAGLLQQLADAGFTGIRIAAQPYMPFGIVWPEPWSVPIVARAPA